MTGRFNENVACSVCGGLILTGTRFDHKHDCSRISEYAAPPSVCAYCNECRAMVEVSTGYGHKVHCNAGLKVRAEMKARQSNDVTANGYQDAASRTLLDNPGFMPSIKDLMLLWNGLGVAGEAGEVADLIKKAIFHRHGLDRAKLVKELGDVTWYVAAICTHTGIALGEVFSANIAKSLERYPDGFTAEASKERADELQLDPDAGITGEWLALMAVEANRKSIMGRLALTCLPDGVNPKDPRVIGMLSLIARDNPPQEGEAMISMVEANLLFGSRIAPLPFKPVGDIATEGTPFTSTDRWLEQMSFYDNRKSAAILSEIVLPLDVDPSDERVKQMLALIEQERKTYHAD